MTSDYATVYAERFPVTWAERYDVNAIRREDPTANRCLHCGRPIIPAGVPLDAIPGGVRAGARGLCWRDYAVVRAYYEQNERVGGAA